MIRCVLKGRNGIILMHEVAGELLNVNHQQQQQQLHTLLMQIQADRMNSSSYFHATFPLMALFFSSSGPDRLEILIDRQHCCNWLTSHFRKPGCCFFFLHHPTLTHPAGEAEDRRLGEGGEHVRQQAVDDWSRRRTNMSIDKFFNCLLWKILFHI